VTADELQRLNADEIGTSVLADMRAGNLYDEDPMDCSGSKASKPKVGQWRLAVSTPELKAPMVSALEATT